MSDPGYDDDGRIDTDGLAIDDWQDTLDQIDLSNDYQGDTIDE